MDFLVMPFSDDGGIDDCDNYCNHCTCNTGACFEKTGPAICVSKCVSNCSRNCWELVCGRGVARRITA